MEKVQNQALPARFWWTTCAGACGWVEETVCGASGWG
jgi:hypothetical protein